MNNINLFRSVAIGTAILLSADCNKVVEFPTPMMPGLPPPLLQFLPNSSQHAAAGPDHVVLLPDDYCTIGGYVSGMYTTVQWSKVSGPTSFSIEDPNSLHTRVSNLVNGVYEFEVSVSSNGLADTDRCTVTVGTVSPNPNEIIFENKKWYPEGPTAYVWGSAIVIGNIHQFVPIANVFNAYIRRDSTTIWEKLTENNGTPYSYFTINGTLCVWSPSKETDTPDVKLVY